MPHTHTLFFFLRYGALDGTVFRPFSTSRTYAAVKRTDNSGICYPYENDAGSQQLVYGYIKNIYTHTLEHNGTRFGGGYAGYVAGALVHQSRVGTMHAGRLPIVRSLDREVWNTPTESYQFVITPVTRVISITCCTGQLISPVTRVLLGVIIMRRESIRFLPPCNNNSMVTART